MAPALTGNFAVDLGDGKLRLHELGTNFLTANFSGALNLDVGRQRAGAVLGADFQAGATLATGDILFV